MSSHAGKTQENKSQAVSALDSQMHSGGESTFQLVDNRPKAVAQRKLQELANNNPPVSQLRAIKEMVNNSPQAKQSAQLPQKISNHFAHSDKNIALNNFNIIQKVDDDHSTIGPNPALWTNAEREEVKMNMYSRLATAKARALAIAKAYAQTNGAPADIQNIVLADFEITQRGNTGNNRIPVEQVYTLRQGQIAASGNDNRRVWIITIDIDDPPYAPGGQRPHVGYTVEVRKVGANAVAVPRDIGHVWLDAVPAGRGALGGVNIWG